MATFTAGIAATLVATALQVGEPSRLDLAAAWALGLTALLTLVVLLLDRLSEARHSDVLATSVVKGWDEDELMKELRAATLTTVTFNEDWLRVMRGALAVQLVCSAVAGVLAALSLLR